MGLTKGRGRTVSMRRAWTGLSENFVKKNVINYSRRTIDQEHTYLTLSPACFIIYVCIHWYVLSYKDRKWTFIEKCIWTFHQAKIRANNSKTKFLRANVPSSATNDPKDISDCAFNIERSIAYHISSNILFSIMFLFCFLCDIVLILCIIRVRVFMVLILRLRARKQAFDTTQKRSIV